MFRQTLRRALRAHLAAPWPESVERGSEIGELDLVKADADIYGWAVASLHGQLTKAERVELTSIADRLEDAVPALPGAASEYFGRLIELGRIASMFRRI